MPVWLPPEVGENLTLTVQDAPAASELPQLLACENWLLAETDEMVCALLPGLLMVTACAELVDPTFWSPNDRLDGEAVSAPGVAWLGKVVRVGVVLQPELPDPRLKVNVPLPDG